MTGASTGLQKALARAGTSVVAIAEMTADDLIAQMTDEQRTALAATLAPEAGANAKPKAEMPTPSDDDEDDQGGAKKKDKMGDGADTGSEASAEAIAKARAEGFAEGTARCVAVMTHDDFGGRAQAAAKLLGNAKLSALSSDEIVEMLDGKPDEGAAAMAAALSQDKNPDLGAGSGAETAKASNHGWGKAVAKINDRFFPAKS